MSTNATRVVLADDEVLMREGLAGLLEGSVSRHRPPGPSTPAAAIVDIEVNKKTGKITVKHVYAAIAPGLVVNPGRVADQVIGTAVMGTARRCSRRLRSTRRT